MDLMQRFWGNVVCRDPDECWEWQASRTRHGYGRIKVGQGRATGAHRLSYLIHKGQIADGLLVCHSCDNPACCNPDHLFLGTYSDNSRDMVAKGRAKGQYGDARSCVPAKIKETDVPQIRELAKSGMTKAAISRHFNVSREAIRDVVNGRTWKHVK